MLRGNPSRTTRSRSVGCARGHLRRARVRGRAVAASGREPTRPHDRAARRRSPLDRRMRDRYPLARLRTTTQLRSAVIPDVPPPSSVPGAASSGPCSAWAGGVSFSLGSDGRAALGEGLASMTACSAVVYFSPHCLQCRGVLLPGRLDAFPGRMLQSTRGSFLLSHDELLGLSGSGSGRRAATASSSRSPDGEVGASHASPHRDPPAISTSMASITVSMPFRASTSVHGPFT